MVFDRERLAALGLDMGVLSETLKNRVLGVVPTRFKEEDRQIDIRIRNREEDRQSVQDVRNLVLPGPDGEPIRLLSVADVTEARGPAEIHRLQQQRAAVVSANLEGRSLGAAIADVRGSVWPTMPPPRGPEHRAGRPEQGDAGQLQQPALRHRPGHLPGLPGDGRDLRELPASVPGAVHHPAGPGRRGGRAAG